MQRYDQQFVSNGLQLYYNPSVSYPGSATSIKDLSNNGLNVTLTNSPTFNAAGNYFTAQEVDINFQTTRSIYKI